MKLLTTFSAIVEAATGVTLFVAPGLGHLLFKVGPAGVGIAFARVCGIGLFCLGVACMPGRGGGFLAILTYNLVITIYFAVLGFGREWAGPLLWPAVVFHALLTLALLRAGLKKKAVVERVPGNT